MSKDEEKKEKTTRPAWQLKQIGSRLVIYAIENFGADFYEDLGKKLGLNELDLDKVMTEIESYYERASCRCPHLDGLKVSEFAKALDEGNFAEHSASSKQARQSAR